MAKIEYKPRSVRELLTEMKDISDAMIDLAYAALLYRDRGMAEQVRKLEAKMDELMYHIRILAAVSARSPDDAEQVTGILQVAGGAEGISNATGDLADLVLRGIDIHPAVRAALKKADEKVAKVKVTKRSPIAGKRFHDLRLPSSIGVWVIAIKRGKSWITMPTRNTKVKPRDTLIARGPEDGISSLCKMAGAPEISWGVGRKFRHLCGTLAEMRDAACMMADLAYSSLLFRSREVAEEVREVEEKFDTLNYKVWLAALRAARRESDLERLNSVLQVVKCMERITDAADSIADIVLRKVELHPVFRQALDEADERITRVKVAKQSSLARRTLGKLDLWNEMGAYVLAIKRGRRYLFNPGKRTTVRAGDFLVIRGSDFGVQKLGKVAAGKAELPLAEG